jgi:hypothetical protein
MFISIKSPIGIYINHPIHIHINIVAETRNTNEIINHANNYSNGSHAIDKRERAIIRRIYWRTYLINLLRTVTSLATCSLDSGGIHMDGIRTKNKTFASV